MNCKYSIVSFVDVIQRRLQLHVDTDLGISLSLRRHLSARSAVYARITAC